MLETNWKSQARQLWSGDKTQAAAAWEQTFKAKLPCPCCHERVETEDGLVIVYPEGRLLLKDHSGVISFWQRPLS